MAGVLEMIRGLRNQPWDCVNVVRSLESNVNTHADLSWGWFWISRTENSLPGFSLTHRKVNGKHSNESRQEMVNDDKLFVPLIGPKGPTLTVFGREIWPVLTSSLFNSFSPFYVYSHLYQSYRRRTTGGREEREFSSSNSSKTLVFIYPASAFTLFCLSVAPDSRVRPGPVESRLRVELLSPSCGACERMRFTSESLFLLNKRLPSAHRHSGISMRVFNFLEKVDHSSLSGWIGSLVWDCGCTAAAGKKRVEWFSRSNQIPSQNE